MNTPISQLSPDGYDLQFATNIMGHYVLTKRLLPQLRAGAQSSSDKKARVVHTSSSAQLFVDTVDFETLRDGPVQTKLGTAKLYMQSKFVSSTDFEPMKLELIHFQANIVLSNEFARRYGSEGIVSTCLNPGNLKTDLQRHTTPLFMLFFVSNRSSSVYA